MAAYHSHIVQVAGVRSMDEARTLVQCGVDFLGFPLHLDLHEQDLSDEEAAAIIRTIIPPHFAVVITYDTRADDIVRLADHVGVTIVQLHGEVACSEIERVRELRPQLRLTKSLVVRQDKVEELFSALERFAPLVDAFITDTYDPATGASGATGRIHDWSVSRRIVESSDRPVILAGGLTPENVADAIGEVKPAGVDAHTGVENAEGDKDRVRVQRFVEAARAAFALHGPAA